MADVKMALSVFFTPAILMRFLIGMAKKDEKSLSIITQKSGETVDENTVASPKELAEMITLRLSIGYPWRKINIRIEDLEALGYTQDPAGLKHFERIWAIPKVAGVIGFVVSFVLLATEVVGVVGIILAACFWCLIPVSIWMMHLSHPRSRHSGRPLLKFKDHKNERVIYVCPESKTYSVL